MIKRPLPPGVELFELDWCEHVQRGVPCAAAIGPAHSNRRQRAWLPLWWRPRGGANRNRFLRIIPTRPARPGRTLQPIGVGISGDCPGRILRSAGGVKYHPFPEPTDPNATARSNGCSTKSARICPASFGRSPDGTSRHEPHTNTANPIQLTGVPFPVFTRSAHAREAAATGANGANWRGADRP